MDDDAQRAAKLRARARSVRRQVGLMTRRAAAMPDSLERDMLKAQAGMLSDGAKAMEDDALLLDPAKGEA